MICIQCELDYLQLDRPNPPEAIHDDLCRSCFITQVCSTNHIQKYELTCILLDKNFIPAYRITEDLIHHEHLLIYHTTKEVNNFMHGHEPKQSYFAKDYIEWLSYESVRRPTEWNHDAPFFTQ